MSVSAVSALSPFRCPAGASSTWVARTLVMGVLNVTPDSFADGGRLIDPSRAVDAALAMEAAGADLIDVGGESTRPGAEPLPPTRNWRA